MIEKPLTARAWLEPLARRQGEPKAAVTYTGGHTGCDLHFMPKGIQMDGKAYTGEVAAYRTLNCMIQIID